MACVQTHPLAHAHPGDTCAFWRASWRSSVFPLQATKVMLCDMLVRLTAPNQRTAAPAVGSCPTTRPPHPCATRDSRSVAGPCFEAKSGVAFRPILGQRSGLESYWCIAEQWSGVERGSSSQLHGQSLCVLKLELELLYLSHSISRGLANTWGVGDLDVNPVLANHEHQGDVLLRYCPSRNSFSSSKMIKPENQQLKPVGRCLGSNALRCKQCIFRSIMDSSEHWRWAILWPSGLLGKDLDASRGCCLVQMPEEQTLQAAPARLC